MPRDSANTALRLTPAPLSSAPPGSSAHPMKPTRRPPPLPTRPPTDLEPAAAAEWKRLARELVKRESPATILDVDALATYCRTLIRWRTAEAQVAALGLVVKNELGHATQNPYLSVAVTAARELGRLGKSLGLTPAARGELRRGPR